MRSLNQFARIAFTGRVMAVLAIVATGDMNRGNFERLERLTTNVDGASVEISPNEDRSAGDAEQNGAIASGQTAQH